MTQLIELPSNGGKVFAVDPHTVTGVQAYRSTLLGRGNQVFDMSAVWVDNHNIFVCSWSVEQTLAVLNAARRGDAALFAEGYRAGVDAALAGSADEQTLTAAWIDHLASNRTPETAL